MKTFSAKAQDQNPTWWVIDAKNQILGDVAVAAANLLRGKTKPTFTPHVDTGDFVVVLNAADVRLSGKRSSRRFILRRPDTSAIRRSKTSSASASAVRNC